MSAGGQQWQIVELWYTNRVDFSGDMIVLSDPWVLTDPKTAFAQSPRRPVRIELTCRSAGREAVLGADQVRTVRTQQR